MLWKCCTPYASKFGKLSHGHRTGKGQFSFQSQRKAKSKNVQTTPQLHSSHMLASEIAQLCPTLCDPMDCNLPGSSVHGILQARILEWVAISFSKGSSQPRDWTWVSCLVGRRFNLWATREVPHASKVMLKILQTSTWTGNFQMFKLDFAKAEELEIKLPKSVGSSKKQESSRKHILLLYWLHQSLWLCGSQQTVENS